MRRAERRSFPRRPFATFGVLAAGCLAAAVSTSSAAEPPTRTEAVAAIRRATAFYHGSVASHGGYLYAYSADLTLREGEDQATIDDAWVQPPGTPAVGLAYLDAYAATGDETHLRAARDAGECLILGQLRSGGWDYSITFDPEKRSGIAYRCGLDGRPQPGRGGADDAGGLGGWDIWKRRKGKGNVTTFDDDVTQAAIRFLVRLDAALGFEDERVHEAAGYALASMLAAQYPNGAWSANHDRFPTPPTAAEYPVVPATYPADWPRGWPKDFTGCYVLNDDLIATAIDTLLLAAEVYAADADLSKRCLAAAERAGGFLLLAQVPGPQPAWAQQYDRDMHPVWSRAFEPPAVSGGESQRVLESLLTLARATGDAKYLDPIPRAVAYLRASMRSDGTLARFYELETNRPIYFTREGGGRHEPTYADDRIATGYGYVVNSRLDAIEAEYRRLRATAGPQPPPPPKPVSAAAARRTIDALDARGAWVTPGRLRAHKADPPGGVIDSRVFADNVRTLCRSLQTRPAETADPPAASGR